MITSKKIVEEYLKKTDWRVRENSNSPYCYGGMGKYASSEVFKDYWLRYVYPEHITQQYLNGNIHIHDLGGLTLYTYFGKETIIVKTPEDKILCTSFQLLYDSLCEKERCVNSKDDVWQIDILGYKVLDKNGWTDIQRLTRKRKHRDMMFVKNEQGRSVIVTDNHPMLARENNIGEIIEKPASQVLENQDYLFSADIKEILKNEKLFHLDYIDLLEEMPKQIGRNIVYADSYPINQKQNDDNVKNIHTTKSSLPRYLHLTKELGFAIGFILAEGSFTKDSSIGAINIKNKNLDDINRVVNALREINCFCSVTLDKETGVYTIHIANELFSYLLRVIMNIQPYSLHKNLPERIIEYNLDFVKGIISGVIDGDGSGNSTQITIRVASRTMLEQIAILLPFIGLFGRDRSIEGQGTIHHFNGRELRQNYPIYGLSFRKQENVLFSQKYDSIKTSKSHWRTEELNSWSKILDIKPVNIPDDYIYDITTKSHTLLVNGMYNHNCTGYSLKNIINMGVQGIPNIPTSSPAKHFGAILNQIANLTTVYQNEIMGAVAYNSFDTLLAPFAKKDNLNYKQIKQEMQNFIFSINSNSRGGAEPAFSNLSFDLTPSKDLLNEFAVIAGEKQPFTYKECQSEINMINKTFCELMIEGDSKGKPFSYPIPTYNIHERFDWDNPNNDLLWEMAGKYGYPYFANYLNSDMQPEDSRSMCCRLKLDLRELSKRNGGLFGSGDSTGSIGVVTINLPRIAYLNKGNKEMFYNYLSEVLEYAKDSLEIKRKWLQENVIDTNFIPAFNTYVGTLKNHFSTIGVVGMNEMCENFIGQNILSKEGKTFAIEVGNFIRNKLVEFQEETGNLYNFEATPAESTCYRLASKDKKEYPDIITRGTRKAPYYTNSCHIPVDKVQSVKQIFDNQNDLQILFTGGTVVHLYMNSAISGSVAKQIVKTVCEEYKVPYISLSPLNRYCDVHGYISESVNNCPYCGSPLKMYQRITGYLRCVDNFNDGKKSEFNERKQLVFNNEN